MIASSGSRPFDRFSGSNAARPAANRLQPDRLEEFFGEIGFGDVFRVKCHCRDGEIIWTGFGRQIINPAYDTDQHRRNAVLGFGESVGVALGRATPHARDVFHEAFALAQQKIPLRHSLNSLRPFRLLLRERCTCPDGISRDTGEFVGPALRKQPMIDERRRYMDAFASRDGFARHEAREPFFQRHAAERRASARCRKGTLNVAERTPAERHSEDVAPIPDRREIRPQHAFDKARDRLMVGNGNSTCTSNRRQIAGSSKSG